MNYQIGLARFPNLNKLLQDDTPINALYITFDLRDSDYLTHYLHQCAPGIYLETSIPSFERIEERILTGKFDVILFDNHVPHADSLQLITGLDRRKITPAVLVILGANDSPGSQPLLKHADDHIVRGPNFIKALADLIRRAAIRNKIGIRRRMWIDPLDRDSTPTAATDAAGRTSQEESRGFQRRRTKIPCDLIFDGNVHAAHIIDLSEGGAFLNTSDLPPVGQSVHLVITEDRAKAVQEGVVVHVGWYLGDAQNFFGCGVRFIKMTEDGKYTIHRLHEGNTAPAMSKLMLTP